jgi:hypothetical protein
LGAPPFGGVFLIGGDHMSVVEWDFQARLRASQAASVQKLSLYLPNKDKDDQTVAHLEDWIDAAINLLTDINGGSTRMPVAKGTWAMRDGRVLKEDTTVVYSYIEEPDEFDARFEEITTFVHKFGRSTRQDSVMVEFSGGDEGFFVSRAYFIRESDYIQG